MAANSSFQIRAGVPGSFGSRLAPRNRRLSPGRIRRTTLPLPARSGLDGQRLRAANVAPFGHNRLRERATSATSA
jgi:hypothetical protein